MLFLSFLFFLQASIYSPACSLFFPRFAAWALRQIRSHVFSACLLPLLQTPTSSWQAPPTHLLPISSNLSGGHDLAVTDSSQHNRFSSRLYPHILFTMPVIQQGKREQLYRQTPKTTSKMSTSVPFKEIIQELPPNTSCDVHQPFASLPNDIAMCIFDELQDHIDKVCFALTTKSLWALTHGKLRLERYKLPVVLPPRVTRQRGVISDWSYFTSSRWRLLEKLEDSHWKCCAGCLRLQPKTEFFPGEIYKEPQDRYCRAPGLIQLCPHIYLTHKKCMKLHQALLNAQDSDIKGTKANFKVNNSKANMKKGIKGKHDISVANDFRHECKLVKEGVELTFTLAPFLSPKLKQLIIQTIYNVKNFQTGELKESLENFGDKIVLPCPHHGILTHFLDILHDSEWDPHSVDGNVKDMNRAMCKDCESLFFDFRNFTHSISQKHMLEFKTNRTIVGKYLELGDCKVGYGSADGLQAWINKTHLANLLSVNPIHEKCSKCRSERGKQCSKMLPFERLTWKPSMPDVRWKVIH